MAQRGHSPNEDPESPRRRVALALARPPRASKVAGRFAEPLLPPPPAPNIERMVRVSPGMVRFGLR